ncbi:TrkH family potassium uptake protein [Rhodobacteraceae bacterium 2376]|uniref:Trk system potassium uptake protein n=1 Tax=Rhabdonatronobacter sediminivivens TaxID=2743469 RepID=A0A7Z0KZ15_9RHOB|nr:TrkH family potassium uptake protein [Rhabdonatronobacter sediminivivens]NYS25879.1 TrkH family potassium uptake protein [Rhabdonatronobacter sediminivivens]
MIDIRPVAHVMGILTAALGMLMLMPAALDWSLGNDTWKIMASCAAITLLCGTLSAVATIDSDPRGLTTRQAFLLTVGTWAILPLFGALPFYLAGLPGGWTHAFFEAMSGVTTTGTTVYTGLDEMARGLLLWRSILQWLGGLGIIIVALVFLPVMRVGGMQYFKAEAFDTMGKVMPRALDISSALLQTYLLLTAVAGVVYMALGMNGFDAANHAMTTIATGGFSTSDQSFGKFGTGAEYAGGVLMLLAGLPFIRYVQLVNGSLTPIYRDIQVRAFLRWTVYAVGAVVAYRLVTSDAAPGDILRESFFNVVSLFTGTGYGTADVALWGDFPLLVVLVVGFIGACTASTGCSLKVFRYLVLFEAIRARLFQLRHPNRVVQIRLGGRVVEDDVIRSVMVLFTVFIAGYITLAVLLTLTGLETRTALTAAWTAICNIGPAFGPEVGATGAVDGFPQAAKWLMILGMLLGRLELIAVLVLLLPRFWRG